MLAHTLADLTGKVEPLIVHCEQHAFYAQFWVQALLDPAQGAHEIGKPF